MQSPGEEHRDLEKANDDLTEAELRIAKQRALVAELRPDGLDATGAVRLLSLTEALPEHMRVHAAKSGAS